MLEAIIALHWIFPVSIFINQIFNIEGIKSAFNRARKPSIQSFSSFSPHSRSPTLTLRRLLPDAESLLSYITKKRGFIRRFFIKHQPHGNLHRISNSLSSLCERWFNDWIVTIHPGIIFHNTKFREMKQDFTRMGKSFRKVVRIA